MASNRHTPDIALSQNPIAVRKREARRLAREARLRAEAALPPLPPEPEPGEPAVAPTVTPDEPAPAPQAAPTAETPSDSAPELPPLGDAPTPPGISVDREYTPNRVATDSRGLKHLVAVRGRDTAWHRKWKSQMVGGGGREQACEMAAEQCVQLASKMDQIIIASGSKPRAPAESMRAPLVLTIDQFMPDKAGEMLEKPLWQLLFVVGISVGQTLVAIQTLKRAGAAPVQAPQPIPVTRTPPPQPTPVTQTPPPIQRTVVQPPPQSQPEWPQRTAPLPPRPAEPTREELAQFQTDSGDYTV